MDHGRPVVGVAAVVAVTVEIVVEGYAVVGILAAVVVDVAESSVADDAVIGCLIALVCYAVRGHGKWIDRKNSARQFYAPPSPPSFP